MTKKENEVKEEKILDKLRNKQVHIIDAVIVGTVIYVGVSALILSKGTITIHFRENVLA